MKQVQNYLLTQVAAKALSKKDALPMLKELHENQSKTVKIDDIAVVGMACRFPGANGPNELWDNMVNGVYSVRDFPEERKKDVDLPIRDYFKGKRNAPKIEYRRGAYLDRIDLFDSNFFNITPAEARSMDPLQRIFLEVTWEAFEDAGYSEKELYGSRTGIYVGDTDADYLKLIQEMEPYALPGNTLSVIASRISYLLNLSSGSHLIDTACSASLGAVHHAVKGLATGDCDMAVVGGLNLTLFPIDEGLTDIGIASPDSIARTFDAGANGTVWGEGFGVVVLKNLKKAKKDGNHIHAVIKGSSMNSDGKSNGITAPSGLAQSELIKEAWRNAGIPPHTISYIEAHGTGTKLGDPIEIEGITNAFRCYTDERQFCALGAVKTNIGHLDTAAGIAGLIKTILSLKNKKIPATLHFKEPNPHINFIDSPLYVNNELVPWETKDGIPRRAGVSAFGIAGTNCHVILEEYEEDTNIREEKEPEKDKYIFTLSAKSRESFNKLLNRYLSYLENTRHSLENICYTSNVGRGHYAYRLAIPVSSISDLKDKINLFILANEDKRYNLTYKGIYYTYLSKRVDNQFMISPYTDIQNIISEYMLGSDINWEEIFEPNLRRLVPLPVYPFSGKRFWIDYIPERHSEPVQIPSSQNEINQWFYQLDWVSKSINSDKNILNKSDIWIIFSENTETSETLGELLKSKGSEVVFVKAANTFSEIESNKYQINPSSGKDYMNLLSKLSDEKMLDRLSGVVHLWTCTEIKSSLKNSHDLTVSQDKGVLSIFHFIKAVEEFNCSTNLAIKVISNYANLVVQEDSYLFPEKATLWGLMKVVAQEYPTYRVSCMDVDTIGRKDSDIAEEIYQEIIYASEEEDLVSAWRNGNRYTQELVRINLNEIPVRDIKIRDSGTYLIVGGAGDVGVETCRYLAQNSGGKLIILGRTSLPDKADWQAILRNSESGKIKDRIRNLLAIEESGAEVIYYSVDVTDLERMKNVVSEIKENYGQLHGVINAAMHLEERRLKDNELSSFLRTMDAKIKGTWVLSEITKDLQLDFFILFSSVASILGGVGLGSYAAANAFMDQFAHYQNRRAIQSMSINWSYFEMGATSSQITNEGLAEPIKIEQYFMILDQLLKYHLPQVTIANIRKEQLAQSLDLLKVHFSSSVKEELSQKVSRNVDPVAVERILKSYRELKDLISSNEALNDAIQRNMELVEKFVSFEEDLLEVLEPKLGFVDKHSTELSDIQIRLSGNSENSYTETEMELARIWGRILGIEEIDIHSDFFENGDSLMLMSVIDKINEQFALDLSIQVFYQEPTIHGLGVWIDSTRESNFDDSDCISVLPRHFSKD